MTNVLVENNHTDSLVYLWIAIGMAKRAIPVEKITDPSKRNAYQELGVEFGTIISLRAFCVAAPGARVSRRMIEDELERSYPSRQGYGEHHVGALEIVPAFTVARARNIREPHVSLWLAVGEATHVIPVLTIKNSVIQGAYRQLGAQYAKFKYYRAYCVSAHDEQAARQLIEDSLVEDYPSQGSYDALKVGRINSVPESTIVELNY